MSNRTITSANSIFTLFIPDVFPIPVTLEGYATDDAFATDGVDAAETMMGVDGKMSAGFTPFITPMTVSLQADSKSMSIFDSWISAEEAAKDLYFANATIVLPSIGTSYICTKGALKNIKKISDVKKTLGPRQFQIHWELVQIVPLA